MLSVQTVADPKIVRQAEIDVLASINDLVVYAIDPAVYDAQTFLGWDSNELLGLTNFLWQNSC